MKEHVEEIYQYTWTCDFCGIESGDQDVIVRCEKRHKENLKLEERFRDVDSMSSFAAALKAIEPKIEVSFGIIYNQDTIIRGYVSFSYRCDHQRNDLSRIVDNFNRTVLESFGFITGTGGGGWNGSKKAYEVTYDFRFELNRFPKLQKAVNKYLEAKKQEDIYNTEYSKYRQTKESYISSCVNEEQSVKEAYKVLRNAEALLNQARDIAREKHTLVFCAANPEPKPVLISSKDLQDEIFNV